MRPRSVRGTNDEYSVRGHDSSKMERHAKSSMEDVPRVSIGGSLLFNAGIFQTQR
jgi:hypothetical protein